MTCPKCEQDAGEAGVLDSRKSENGIRRRRVCGACGKRFTTFESAVFRDSAGRVSIAQISRMEAMDTGQCLALQDVLSGLEHLTAVVKRHLPEPDTNGHDLPELKVPK